MPPPGPEGARPDVDVVILSWNDADLLDAAVASALDQGGVATRVIVVDNGSTVPVRAGGRPGVETFRSDTNLGVGGGRNLGVRAGAAPLVCFLDSDARLHPGALTTLTEPLRHDPGLGLVGPVFDGQAPEASAGQAPTLRRKLARAANRTDRYARSPGQGEGAWWEVDFTIGACQVFRRAAFDAVGGVDASARFGPEDVDFCLRLRAAGWTVAQVGGHTCQHPPRRAARRLLTRRGLAHGVAFARHWWRHRSTPQGPVRGSAVGNG